MLNQLLQNAKTVLVVRDCRMTLYKLLASQDQLSWCHPTDSPGKPTLVAHCVDEQRFPAFWCQDSAFQAMGTSRLVSWTSHGPAIIHCNEQIDDLASFSVHSLCVTLCGCQEQLCHNGWTASTITHCRLQHMLHNMTLHWARHPEQMAQLA